MWLDFRRVIDYSFPWNNGHFRGAQRSKTRSGRLCFLQRSYRASGYAYTSGLLLIIYIWSLTFLLYPYFVAMYDWITTICCTIAVLTGLTATIFLLAIAKKALPALPISIAFGMLFYFVAKTVLVPFVGQVGVLGMVGLWFTYFRTKLCNLESHFK